MQTIHKFEFPIVGPLGYLNGAVYPLEMPRGAKVLTAQLQNGIDLVLWAKVDTAQAMVTRNFKVYDTGFDMPDSDELWYISTVQQNSGRLIWHVFEVMSKPS